jgi:murein DD-endopeptidase MepM/ murein hydrolase activator NlpD
VAVDITSPITDPAKAAYKGIIVQKGANKGGYGYVISATTGDRDPQSGGVSLTAK